MPPEGLVRLAGLEGLTGFLGKGNPDESLVVPSSGAGTGFVMVPMILQ